MGCFFRTIFHRHPIYSADVEVLDCVYGALVAVERMLRAHFQDVEL